MTTGIVISVIVIAVVLALVWTWYRRTIAGLDPNTDQRTVSGARLTAERLRDLPTPPWRVVYEIAEGTLGDVDHVAVGPIGPIALVTVMADRPAAGPPSGAQAVANAAVTRGDVDDLTRRVGVSCDLLAKVYWGTPNPDGPAASDVVAGQVHVEGQRLDEWLVSLGGDMPGSQIDLAWQSVVTGIGRPDPLA